MCRSHSDEVLGALLEESFSQLSAKLFAVSECTLDGVTQLVPWMVQVEDMTCHPEVHVVGCVSYEVMVPVFVCCPDMRLYRDRKCATTFQRLHHGALSFNNPGRDDIVDGSQEVDHLTVIRSALDS